MAQVVGSRPFPWHLVLYLDELAGGNPLRPDNSRKVCAWYIGFKEFQGWLQCETMWFPIACLRGNIISQVNGGLSCCTRMILETVLLNHSFITGFDVNLKGEILTFSAACSSVGREQSL